MKKTLCEMVGARKQATRKYSFSLIENNLIARPARTEDDTELEKNLKDQMDDERERLEAIARMMLCGVRE